MNFESVLIITYGRTGSTLLQGILNTIDGCLVRGENYNMCFGFFNAYRNMRRTKNFSGESITTPWYGAEFLDESILIESSKALMKKLLLGDAEPSSVACYGFKETRYINMSYEDLYQYIDFLTMIFPKPAIIFNTRNLDDVSKSAWWREKPKTKVFEMLKSSERVFNQYSKDNSNTYQLTYEDIIAKSDNFRGMFDFLGVEYSDVVVDEVLGTPHSYNPVQENIQDLFRNQ